MEDISLSISIDTEEDDWGSFEDEGASTRNILHLPELQDTFDRWGARPTYLVNRPPLVDSRSVEILGELASRTDVEIGGHCHPWNTPPATGTGAFRSMMCNLTEEENRAKIEEINGRLQAELGVRPKVFRAGRWGFGPTVAAALVQTGYQVDCSVCPFVDWSASGGPDFSEAPHGPYRFSPAQPLQPDPHGSLLELPPTIGFLRGDHRRAASLRRRLEQSLLGRTGVVGLLDRAGLLTKRWLSPEKCSGRTMTKMAEAAIRSGQRFLQLTFHSSALLPGATPFVGNEAERSSFLRSIATFLAYCHSSGFTFQTLSEAGERLGPRLTDGLS